MWSTPEEIWECKWEIRDYLWVGMDEIRTQDIIFYLLIITWVNLTPISMSKWSGSTRNSLQWLLSYVQRGLADIWKENLLENLEAGSLEYKIVREFLADLKKEFREGDNKMMKVAELKRIEQRNRTMEEFIQEFRRVARDSEYEERLLVEKFKQGMNEVIRKKLMGAKRPPRSIEQ